MGTADSLSAIIGFDGMSRGADIPVFGMEHLHSTQLGPTSPYELTQWIRQKGEENAVLRSTLNTMQQKEQARIRYLYAVKEQREKAERDARSLSMTVQVLEGKIKQLEGIISKMHE